MENKKKKVPLRKCVACGESKAKRDLLRVVYNKEDGVGVDPTGKKNGRGAYLCRSLECVERAKKNRRLHHALRTNISDEIFEEIKHYVAQHRE